jgi:predicted 3-demethylubiquinone-9 3-methyltransferase (glyoxalase superfamily)
MSDKITTCLWFDTEGEEAAEFYCTLFPDSKITGVSHYGEAGPRPAGTVLTVDFQLDGRPYVALNGGPEYQFTEAVSFQVSCSDQDEVDRYWDTLTADGGEAGQCGWLKDRFGLSWQIVPTALPELLSDPDPGRSSRAMQAMLQMQKIDIAAMRAAADEG